ncbi:MAG: hypothetical protein ACREC5_04175 [Thermoplasmata archaeon]
MTDHPPAPRLVLAWRAILAEAREMAERAKAPDFPARRRESPSELTAAGGGQS